MMPANRLNQHGGHEAVAKRLRRWRRFGAASAFGTEPQGKPCLTWPFHYHLR